jgi:hypothetical protein
MNLATRCLPALLGMLSLAHARPVVIENVSTIKNPNPALWTEFPVSVAIDRDHAIVTAQRWEYPNPEQGRVHQTGFLYKRSGAGWVLVRQLEETVVNGGTQNSLGVAMNQGVAAVQTTPMTIYQRGASGNWNLVPSQVALGDNSGFDLEIDGGRILNGEGTCAWNAGLVEKSADGFWRRSNTLAGSFRGCAIFNRGGAVDISGDWAVVHQTYGLDVPFGEEQAWIYRRNALGWSRQGVAPVPWEQKFWANTQVAINGSDVFVSAGHESGILVFREEAGQGFKAVDRIQPLDSYMGGGETFQLDKSPNYLLQKANMYDRGPESTAINVYQHRANGSYEHTAVLVARQNKWTWFPFEQAGSNVAISGRTVLATDTNEQLVYHFEIPESLATPEPLQDTFATGNAPDWTTSAGSQFTVLRGDRSRLLRQAQSAGETRAIYEPADWTNQAIEVDVKPNVYADESSAISLITRWQGPHNYYEFVWGPKRFEFRRMASGTLRTLVSHQGQQFNPPRVAGNYRVRLESIGTLHRVYINGLLYFSITSSGPTHGQVGVGTYNAGADFDNVLVTPTPQYSMYRNKFDMDDPVPWKKSGLGSWRLEWDDHSNLRVVQSNQAGEGRVTIGVPTTEQSVEARARVIGFAAPEGTQRRWFGVVARYVDERNHYILALRNSNVLVLTRRVNGVDTTLGSFAVPVVPGQYYSIRLDAIGTQLRAYLDDRLLFEACDDAHPSGNYGMTTFKTHAEFNKFVAYQP